MSIQQTLRTAAIHLAIITAGLILISAALHERFDIRLYLYLAGISIARDAWQTWKASRANQSRLEVTYQEPEEGVWPPPPRRPQ